MTELGTITADGDTRSVRFERLYDATPDELWRALTDPEQLCGWLAHVTRDAVAPGAEWEIRFGEQDAGIWRVREVVECAMLEVDWIEEGQPHSVLRFEIVPRASGGTALVLHHRRLSTGSAPGYGAGWHAHLEALERLLDGEGPGDDDAWWRRYEALRPAYEEQAAAV